MFMSNLSFDRALLAVAAFVALLVFGGCGSGSSEDSTSSVQSSPSKQSAQAPSADATKGKQVMSGKAKRDEAGKSSRDRDRQGKDAKPHGAHGDGSESPRTPAEKVNERLKEILNATGGAGGGKQVVASPKKIRKILKELKEGSSDGDSKGSSKGGVGEAIEEVLGR